MHRALEASFRPGYTDYELEFHVRCLHCHHTWHTMMQTVRLPEFSEVNARRLRELNVLMAAHPCERPTEWN